MGTLETGNLEHVYKDHIINLKVVNNDKGEVYDITLINPDGVVWCKYLAETSFYGVSRAYQLIDGVVDDTPMSSENLSAVMRWLNNYDK